jgi:predicted ATPase
VLATQRADGVVIELGPLESASVLSLATDTTGGLPGPRLAARLTRAAGNPLFVVELLAALLRDGKISVGPGGAAEMQANLPPTSLAVSILHRLALLPAEAVELLRLAAVCGQEVDPAELSLLSGGDAVAVGTALRAAEQGGLLEVRDGHLRFRHELVHDTLYNDWPKPVVRSLHRDLGTRLAADGAPAWRVAHHLSLGAAEGDMLAVDWLHRAGLEAAPRDPFAAVQLLERAVDLVPPNAPERDTIRTDLSVALVWAGRADEAGKLAASVIAESLDAEIRGRTAWWLASTLVLRGRPQEARAVCDRALRSGAASDTVALMLQIVGEIAAMATGDNADGPRRLRDLLAVATSVGDQIAQTTCHLGRGRGRGQRRAAWDGFRPWRGRSSHRGICPDAAAVHGQRSRVICLDP